MRAACRMRAAVAAVAVLLGGLATSTAWAEPALVQVGSASGSPGEGVTIAVSLATAGRAIAALQNDVGFDPGTPIAAKANGRPDCRVNPEIDKSATSFTFLPAGCTAGLSCNAMHVIVIGLDNSDPIADGAVLYSCTVRISAGQEPGRYPLTNTNVQASDAAGQIVPATGAGGTITVVVAPVVSIDVGSAAGVAGHEAVFAVTLRLLQPTALVAAAENRITFDPAVPIAAAADGAPACAINEAIEKNATSFTFEPLGCTPQSDCSRIHAVVLSLENSDAIADGAVLYSCQVDIPPQTPEGVYALSNSMVRASDPAGEALPAAGASGSVQVMAGCIGDCDGDDAVTVEELVLGVNVALGNGPLASCPQFDANGDGVVTIEELIQAVNAALDGC